MTRAIESTLVLLAIVSSISIYHFAVVERTAQRFALLDISPDSVGNVPVTCRSAENRIEGQLAEQVSSHYRPL